MNHHIHIKNCLKTATYLAKLKLYKKYFAIKANFSYNIKIRPQIIKSHQRITKEKSNNPAERVW